MDNIRQKSEQEPKVSGSTAYILLHSRSYIHTYVVRPEHVHPLRLVESQRAARHYICAYIRMSAGALEAETSVDSQRFVCRPKDVTSLYSSAIYVHT